MVVVLNPRIVRFSKKSGSTRAIAKRALRLAKKNQGETGFRSVTDSIVPSAVWQTTGSDYLSIIQGDGITQRVGDEVDLTGVHLRCVMGAELTELADACQYVRVVLWANTISDIQPTLPSPLLSDQPISDYDREVKGLKVLYDRNFLIGSADNTNGLSLGTGGLVIDKFIRWRKTLKYATSSTANPQNAVLVLSVIAENAFTSSPFTSSVTVMFKDH